MDAGEHVYGPGVDPQCLGVCRGNVCRGAVLDCPGRTTGRGQGSGGSRLWTVVGLAVGAGLFLTYVLVSLGNTKTDLQFTYSPSSTLPTGGTASVGGH